jgi:glycosyltransferase involved in cell wall biosynthesis
LPRTTTHQEARPVDVLFVSPGTTAGWRKADAQLAALLRDLGLSVAIATTEFGVARHLRRTVVLTDLAEAAALRRVTTKALHAHRPRAILYSSTQATMLQPRARLARAGVRFDALTTANRPGRRNALLHRLERRALERVAVLLPLGLDATGRVPDELLHAGDVVALPIPVERPASHTERREPLVVSYAGNPDKKGLDTIAAAWRLVPPAGRRLIVTGINADRGRAFLRARGVSEPAGLEWAGSLGPDQYRGLLEKAEAYLSASRFEDYGLAQLEALAAGTPLVTTPSAGPFEALALARELEPALVARDASPEGLATALRAALEMPAEARADYAKRAGKLLAPYSEEELRRRVEEQVLPLLLR